MMTQVGGGDGLSRRRLIALGMSGAAAALLGCRVEPAMAMDRGRGDDGRLRSRPKKPDKPHEAALPGTQALGLASGRDGLIHVPTGYRPGELAPLVLMLHGAGGSARGGLRPLVSLADEAGLVLLAPDARSSTWDAIHEGFGADVAFIDRALAQTFERYDVDPARIAIAGFSDGASYALSLGITNGDLFGRVIAFSPGFMVPGERHGTPRFFVSHGTNDRILPIDRSSRRLVPELRGAGYDVLYREFEGPHAVPPDIAREAKDWLAGAPR